MLFLLFALLSAAVCAAPVTLRAAFIAGHTAVLKLKISMPFLSRSHTYQVVRTAQGHRLLTIGRTGEKSILPSDFPHGIWAAAFSAAFRSKPSLRRFLLRHIACEDLNVSLRFHADDAARTAVFTGLLRMVAASFLPGSWRRQVRLSIQPDFLRRHTSLYAQGILRTRLGILLLTGAAMLVLAVKKQIMNRLKEESAYGASHR